MDKFGFLTLLFALFLFQISVNGQENYAVKTFTTDQGLPHNHVMGIAQDKNGFIWIATWDGLSRYNGYEFKNYYHNPSDSSSLLYFNVYNVEVDFENQVWAQCGNVGFSLYDQVTDNFVNFPELPGVTDIALDPDSMLWMLCNQDIKKWNYQNKQFDSVKSNLNTFNFKDNSYRFLYLDFDNKGGIWLNYTDNSGGFSILHCEDAKREPLNFRFLGEISPELLIPNFYSANLTSETFISDTGNFWLVSNNGIFKLDKTRSIFKKWNGEIPQEEIGSASSKTGLNLFRSLKYFNPSQCFSGQPQELIPGFVESFCIDHQETVWLSLKSQGSESTGLTRCIPVKNYFKHYFFDQNQLGKLNAIFSVLKDKNGSIWAAPQNLNGIFKRMPDGKVVLANSLDPKLRNKVRYPRVMLEDSTGIWIGYFNRLLLYYDFTTGKQSVKMLKKNGPEDTSLPESIIHIAQDGPDLILFSYSAIYRYQPKSEKIVLIFDSKEKRGLYSYLKDKNGDWWIGLGISIFIHFDKDFNLIKTYKIGKTRFNIESICEGDDNDLWLALLGGGLARFDRYTAEFKIFSTADGLSNNTCYGILKDTKGNLWISTNHGISRFNPKTQQFRTFGPSDGLKIDEFNSDATFQAADGEMFFGGMGGVVSFYPDSITDNQKGEQQPLIIENFKVSGANRFFNKAIYECDTVVLNKGDDNFEASFACLDFRNADRIKYRYRLSGENNEFVTTDHRHRSVNYSSLEPGEYRLEIEATNREGDWLSKTALLIVIPSFYYQTIWFRLLVVSFLVLLIIYLVYGYNRRIRLIARQQQEELRLESLRGQMNPHFIFNSLNSINYFISQNDRLSANRYIADFSRLIRTILGNTASDYIPLTKELESLQDYLKLEHLRFGDKFDYSIQLAGGLTPEDISVFPGMVQPFIENSIWHGMRGLENRKGTMKIEFSQGSPCSLRCVVEDDGIGRKRSEKCKSPLPGKTSRGIGIVLERLKIINNLRQSNFQVNIEDVYPDREDTGTRVVIDIPVKI
jgi:ligand-binding sensor domain-containing protein